MNTKTFNDGFKYAVIEPEESLVTSVHGTEESAVLTAETPYEEVVVLDHTNAFCVTGEGIVSMEHGTVKRVVLDSIQDDSAVYLTEPLFNSLISYFKKTYDLQKESIIQDAI